VDVTLRESGKMFAIVRRPSPPALQRKGSVPDRTEEDGREGAATKDTEKGGVEYVGNREAADGEYEPVGRARAGELVGVGVDLLGLAAEIDGLPQEPTLDAGIGQTMRLTRSGSVLACKLKANLLDSFCRS
jgi:hypothetical protein